MPRCGSFENVISTEEAGFFMNWGGPVKIRLSDLRHHQQVLHARGQNKAPQPRIVETLGSLGQTTLGDASDGLLAIEAEPLLVTTAGARSLSLPNVREAPSACAA